MPIAGEKSVHLFSLILLFIGIFQLVVSGLLIQSSVGGEIGCLYVGIGIFQ